ncbi:FMN-binding protein [Natronincola ferrireducens]|uniref:FMN-binding domain-containing protein n=1 Tax=Natronincola ferrireducens TaxID=393762 RepID=A0A1G8ZMZ4_9FIRM|nr:FMN-binding protein [Natronincola ferrireducens]SDK16373.1 FMN-binding domain-containing protein [Natronincola ferrireducens]
MIIGISILGCSIGSRDKVPLEVQAHIEETNEVRILNKHTTTNIQGVYYVGKIFGEKTILQWVEKEGFNGKIQLLVTVDVEEDRVLKVEVLDHQETDSYGGYITEDWFLDRFIGKDPQYQLVAAKVTAKNPEDISIVTGATITSEAVINAVNDAMENYLRIKKEEFKR